jgi:2-amino-4-hydroxy-6-hydroxymethyldihydropteridine diphosphokinase
MSGRVFLGLGSNLGDRRDLLMSACAALAAWPRFTLLTRSSLYETQAMGSCDGPDFLNMAVSGLWVGEPERLLRATQSIEAVHGRVRSFRDAPRTLDIDILWWEGLRWNSRILTIPHPRLLQRAFALLPLLELAPELSDRTRGIPLRASLDRALLSQEIAPHIRERAHV